MPLPTQSIDDANWTDRHNLLWRCELSALYHDKRERHLDGWDRLSKLISVLGGAAAFSFIRIAAPTSGGASSLDWAAISAVVIAFTSGLSLVYQYSTRARRHAELARDFKKLLGDIERVDTMVVDASQLGIWKSQLRSLESGEPASLNALVTHCHNELSVAHGHEDHVTPLPWIQRWLMNYLDFSQHTSLHKTKKVDSN